MGGDRMERGQAAERRARLAATLRSNLHRRKAQARERRDLDAGDAPVAPTGDVATPGRVARPILDGDAASAAGSPVEAVGARAAPSEAVGARAAPSEVVGARAAPMEPAGASARSGAASSAGVGEGTVSGDVASDGRGEDRA